MDADIGVIGLGTMGSMAIWHLARKGISVIGFEQFGIGHDKSAAGGETRIFRTAYKEGADYVPILSEARKQWLRLEEESGNKLFNPINGLVIGSPELKSIKNALQSIKEYSLPHEILNFEEAKKQYPQHRLSPNEIMILDKTAGYIRPHYAIISAVNRAEELGAIIHQHTYVEKIHSDSSGVRVLANGKEYNFKKLLITTGPWVNVTLPNYRNLVEIRQVVSTWFAAKNIELFSPDRFPVFTRESKDSSYYGVPSIDEGMVKIALGTTKDSKITNPLQLNKNMERETLSAITNTIESHVPDLYSNPVRVNTYMEAYTVDNNPIIGTVADDKNLVVMCGFSGHGFKMAPVIGNIGADIILENDSQFPINKFSPERFANHNQYN